VRVFAMVAADRDDPLVETFVTAFLAMAAISTAASLLIVKALETIAWRARGRRLHARPDIG